MDWNDWCKTYPCLQAKSLPDVSEFFTFSNRPDAIKAKDSLEMDEEILTTYRVVEYDGFFYVVTKDEAVEICPGQVV